MVSSPSTAGKGHTLASARLLLPKWIKKAMGAFKVLVARCNMCIVRCTFDSGIIDSCHGFVTIYARMLALSPVTGPLAMNC